MTAQNRTVLKALFQDGDKPDGSTYADWIDSMVSIADTTVQVMTSDLQLPKLVATTEVSSPQVNATEVSASAGNFVVLNAQNVSASAGNFVVLNAQNVSASAITTRTIHTSASAHFHGNVVIDGTLELPGREFGELFIAATAAVSASAVYVELISTATAHPTYLNDFTVSAGSLVYGGAVTKTFIVHADVTMDASAANVETFIALATDGSAHPKTEQRNDMSTTDVEIVTHGLLSLATGQRVSVLVKNDDTGGKGYSIKDVHMTVWE